MRSSLTVPEWSSEIATLDPTQPIPMIPMEVRRGMFWFYKKLAYPRVNCRTGSSKWGISFLQEDVTSRHLHLARPHGLLLAVLHEGDLLYPDL